MRKEIINYKDYTLTRVSKRHAKKLFTEGQRIFVKPCNINPASPWCQMYILDHVMLERCLCSYDSLVNEIEYYNCNNETGKYLSYYVESEV